MADSSIEWTDKVWNPVVGCTRVSAGCERCYAERLAHRLELMGQPQYAGLTRKLPNGDVRWTGKVVCLPERLDIPVQWRKPARIFVNSMSDLFHEDVPDEFIGQVFWTMRQAHWHTFQILTKRPARMRAMMASFPPEVRATDNVWLGVSVEDQRAADERIPLLLQTLAAVRFLSCEPLLGPVNLDMTYGGIDHGINWVIAGGESGPGYRSMDLAWIRSLRDQCQAANVPFFAKQNSGPRTHMWLPEDLQSHEFPESREFALA